MAFYTRFSDFAHRLKFRQFTPSLTTSKSNHCIWKSDLFRNVARFARFFCNNRDDSFACSLCANSRKFYRVMIHKARGWCRRIATVLSFPNQFVMWNEWWWSLLNRIFVTCFPYFFFSICKTEFTFECFARFFGGKLSLHKQMTNDNHKE